MGGDESPAASPTASKAGAGSEGACKGQVGAAIDSRTLPLCTAHCDSDVPVPQTGQRACLQPFAELAPTALPSQGVVEGAKEAHAGAAQVG